MKKWRPEGWQRCEPSDFEQGADAMLEALKKNALKVTLTYGAVGLVDPQYVMAMLTKGTFIFIPADDEVNK